MSEISPNLVTQKKQIILHGMAKVSIKSGDYTAFGGIFQIMELFERKLSPVIDRTLGKRCGSRGYRYSEILRTLMCVFFCGGSCVEDISSRLLGALRLHPGLRSCSSDTVLRAINELCCEDTSYTAESGKTYAFNTADRLNGLLVDALMATGQLKPGNGCTLDFDHEFLEAGKYDARRTYKGFDGYSPGVATIGELVVGLENRDGNAPVRFRQQDTLERVFSRLEQRGVFIMRARMDCGSCCEQAVRTAAAHSKYFYIRANRCQSLYDTILALRGWTRAEINGNDCELNAITIEKWPGFPCRLVIQRQRRTDGELDLWEGGYTYRCIITNDYQWTPLQVVLFYNQRGGQEPIFAELDNDFGWNHLPKSFMGQNAVYLLLTALIRNFYLLVRKIVNAKAFGLRRTGRIKNLIYKFISVPARWVKRARQHVLNIYTVNRAYAAPFCSGFI